MSLINSTIHLCIVKTGQRMAVRWCMGTGAFLKPTNCIAVQFCTVTHAQLWESGLKSTLYHYAWMHDQLWTSWAPYSCSFGPRNLIGSFFFLRKHPMAFPPINTFEFLIFLGRIRKNKKKTSRSMILTKRKLITSCLIKIEHRHKGRKGQIKGQNEIKI